MTTYKMTITGDLDSMVDMLVDLLEKEATGFNLNYTLEIGEADWMVISEDESRLKAEMSFDRELERKDLRVFEDSYKVKVKLND